jgi:beta-phosphoglucomutase-like phosphatase (HAD superfamily)
MKLNVGNFEGVAWDFDGTLANAYPVHEAARYEVFHRNGLGSITPEAHRLGHTYGATTSTIIAGVLKAAGELPKDADPYTDPLVQKLVGEKRQLYKEAASTGLEAQPGAVELVRKLGQIFTDSMAIVTTAPLDEVLPFLERYSIGGYFDERRIITEETMLQNDLQLKPEPDAYILAAQVLGIANPVHLLAIEDSPGGVEAAARAGATSLAVGTTNNRERFQSMPKLHQPTFFVPSFAKIAA